MNPLSREPLSRISDKTTSNLFLVFSIVYIVEQATIGMTILFKVESRNVMINFIRSLVKKPF